MSHPFNRFAVLKADAFPGDGAEPPRASPCGVSAVRHIPVESPPYAPLHLDSHLDIIIFLELPLINPLFRVLIASL